MKKLVLSFLMIGMVFCSSPMLMGCATSKKTQVVQMGDEQLSREQLLNEIKRLDEAQSEIDGKKGMTGTNVAAALFWLPGLAYTYYDAGEATRLINDRRAHLTNIYNRKYSDNQATTISKKATSKKTARKAA